MTSLSVDMTKLLPVLILLGHQQLQTNKKNKYKIINFQKIYFLLYKEVIQSKGMLNNFTSTQKYKTYISKKYELQSE